MSQMDEKTGVTPEGFVRHNLCIPRSSYSFPVAKEGLTHILSVFNRNPTREAVKNNENNQKLRGDQWEIAPASKLEDLREGVPLIADSDLALKS